MLRRSFLFLACWLAPAVFAQDAPPARDRVIDAAERKAVIDGVLEQIHKVYVFPDVARKMEEAVRARQEKKEYDAISSGQQLARVLTDHLRAVSKDGHLGVEFSAEPRPKEAVRKPSDEEIRRFRARGARGNDEFKKVEQLDGGIGLLEVNGFYPADWIVETVAGASAFLAHSEAVILDLRRNGGGDPDAVNLLCSYFFNEPTRLSDHHNRAEGTTRQNWTYPVVPGKKLADKDLYILTSRRTFSAPESLAYDMQALKRATIVGETTGGGAHGTTIHWINDHFRAAIPFSRSISPVTGSDWEGTGVKPDVAVPADQALLTAHLMALQKALERHAKDHELADELKRTIERKTKELAALERAGTEARGNIGRLKADVYYFASGTLEGRGISTPGVDLAARHIRAEFKRLGLKSGTPDGSYFQPFEYGRTSKSAGITLNNVIGVLEGKGPAANETIVIGAHYDHLGRGEVASMAPEALRSRVHPGADDNASGTSAVLELARRFAGRSSPPRRRMVFIAFCAEENGRVGSRHYTSQEPIFPIKDTVAMINFDMVGRLRNDELGIAGNESAREFGDLLAAADARSPVKLMLGGPEYPDDSDHASFSDVGVPILYLCTGSHEDRHTPGDTADKINFEGLAKVVDLCEDVLDRLLVVSRPKFVPPPGRSPATRSN